MVLVLKDKKILITGGTGSLGTALTRRLLKEGVEVIRIFSRNENRQVMMQEEFSDSRLRFFIGDVRDKERLKKALEDVDVVFHAAALKHVPVIEYNPFEAIKTNVIGTQNLIEAALDQNVEVVVGIGTDKAVSPLNTYGATKLLMEKLFVTANNYVNPKHNRTRLYAVRYGNVVGSNGSVIPKFIEQIRKNKKITITDPRMTRFSITMDEALDFILNTVKKSKGGEVFVPKLKAYRIDILKEVLIELVGKSEVEKIPIRPGEKIHEILINQDEARYTLESNDDYIIIGPHEKVSKLPVIFPNYKNATFDGEYSSDNVELLSKEELRKIIENSGLL
jgi:UDP-N-acetylglucosamine 4,6-dehydratase/UDP-glucose 4-epimerase